MARCLRATLGTQMLRATRKIQTTEDTNMNAPVHFDPTSDAYTIPLDQIDVSDPRLYQDDIYHPYFERLRREDPVHCSKDGMYGSFWSVTKFKDIMAGRNAPRDLLVRGETRRHHHHRPADGVSPLQLHLDGPAAPRRAAQGGQPDRRARQPQQHVGHHPRARLPVLDGLPRGETFDWVQRVSIELTTLMLATLFDFPLEERRKLTYWSDCATADVNAGGVVDSEEKRLEMLTEALRAFTALWHERAAQPPAAST